MQTTTAPYSEALARFAHKPLITVAAGATCAYLGDERSLREFLVADETARLLREAGHTVFSLLIDDSLDPLNYRQLRVAVNKDEGLLARFEGECGKPIAHVADPFGCHNSLAEHFEHALLDRLRALHCHPTLVSTANLYERGVYGPYVRDVLLRHDEVLAFLAERFPGYTPDRLYRPICPGCGYIDETRLEHVALRSGVRFYCGRCAASRSVGWDDLKGKLSWKLDCALRWALFGIDAEPFNKAYLEPQAGSFVVAQALSARFFQGKPVMPLPYGLVKMDKSLGYSLMASLPPSALRILLIERPTTDLNLTADYVVTAASRHEALPGLSYLDFVKQVLPMWLLTPGALSAGQRELVARGIAFGRNFGGGGEARLPFPSRGLLDEENPAVLVALRALLARVLFLREELGVGASYEAFAEPAKALVAGVGPHKKAVLHRLRRLTGQEQGLPATRFLYLLPADYLRLIDDMLALYLGSLPGADDETDADEDDLPLPAADEPDREQRPLALVA